VVGSLSRARAMQLKIPSITANIISTVQQLVKTSKFAFGERLATAIAESILSPIAWQVQVRLSKPAAIPDFTGKITIELTRERQIVMHNPVPCNVLISTTQMFP